MKIEGAAETIRALRADLSGARLVEISEAAK